MHLYWTPDSMKLERNSICFCPTMFLAVFILGPWGYQQALTALITLTLGLPLTRFSGLGTLCFSGVVAVPVSSSASGPLSWLDLSALCLQLSLQDVALKPLSWPCLHSCFWLHLPLLLCALPGWTLEVVHHLTLSVSSTQLCLPCLDAAGLQAGRWGHCLGCGSLWLPAHFPLTEQPRSCCSLTI